MPSDTFDRILLPEHSACPLRIIPHRYGVTVVDLLQRTVSKVPMIVSMLSVSDD